MAAPQWPACWKVWRSRLKARSCWRSSPTRRRRRLDGRVSAGLWRSAAPAAIQRDEVGAVALADADAHPDLPLLAVVVVVTLAGIEVGGLPVAVAATAG